MSNERRFEIIVILIIIGAFIILPYTPLKVLADKVSDAKEKKVLSDQLSADKEKLEIGQMNMISSCDMARKLIGDHPTYSNQEGLLKACDKPMSAIKNYCGTHEDLNLTTCSDQRIQEYIMARGLPQPQNTINQSNRINQSFANPAENTSTALLNKSKDTKMSTGELGPPTSNDLPSNVQRIINELGNDTSDEIATYPINDLSSDVLVKVLNGLSVDSLYKVLRNLALDDFKTLLHDKLTSEQFTQILDRLPQDKKADIEKRNIAASI